jgi:hypothetical protein
MSLLPEYINFDQKKSSFFFNVGIFIFLFSLIFPSTLFSEPYQRETAVVRAVRGISPDVVNISSEY